MNELQALKWIENQKGLVLYIGVTRHVIITDGFTVEATGTGILDAVVKLQKIIKGVNENETV